MLQSYVYFKGALCQRNSLSEKNTVWFTVCGLAPGYLYYNI